MKYKAEWFGHVQQDICVIWAVMASLVYYRKSRWQWYSFIWIYLEDTFGLHCSVHTSHYYKLINLVHLLSFHCIATTNIIALCNLLHIHNRYSQEWNNFGLQILLYYFHHPIPIFIKKQRENIVNMVCYTYIQV